MDNRQYEEQLHYEQLKQYLKENYDKSSEFNLENLIEQIKSVEELSLDNRRIFSLFSHSDFHFEYISKNVENVMGYTPEEIYKGGLSLGLKSVYWKQISTAIKINQWGLRFEKIVKNPLSSFDYNNYFCGIKMKDKQGNFKVFLLKQKMLTYSKERNKPLISYIEIEEITSLYKRDFIWARMTVSKDKFFHVRAFFSEGKKKEYADLLSERELEILRLVNQRISNKKISEKLGIAINTVERHRKNMIARLGVHDMAGLLYVSRICQLI